MEFPNDKAAAKEYSASLLGRDVRVLEGALTGLTGKVIKVNLDEDDCPTITVYLALPMVDEPPERREIDCPDETGFFAMIFRCTTAQKAYRDDPQPLKSIWPESERQPDGTRRFYACRQARGDMITKEFSAQQLEVIN